MTVRILVGDVRDRLAEIPDQSVQCVVTSPPYYGLRDYGTAHFATFPPEIPRRCILAGSKPGDTIVDPFAGAGTTLLVADQLGRDAIGVELNPEYAAMIERRIATNAPMFAEVETVPVPVQVSML